VDVEILVRHRARRVATAPLGRFARALARELGVPGGAGLTVCLVGDATMRRLNLRWRGKDRTTDVLSFPGGGPDPSGGHHLGDVVISIPTAARQAAEVGHSLAREVRVLLVHGVLHLLGHDHETDDGRMMRLQRRLEGRLLPRARR
jgi:probable rRNA maturation factor